MAASAILRVQRYKGIKKESVQCFRRNYYETNRHERQASQLSNYLTGMCLQKHQDGFKGHLTPESVIKHVGKLEQ